MDELPQLITVAIAPTEFELGLGLNVTKLSVVLQGVHKTGTLCFVRLIYRPNFVKY